MAFASVAAGGTGVIAGASASSFTITTVAAIDLSSSRFALAVISSDNISTSDGNTNNHTSVTGGTGTWTKLGEYTNTVGGAAADGVCTSLWLFVPSGGNATGTVFTVNLSANVVDACAHTRIFTWDTTKGIRQTTEASIVGNGIDASNGFGSAAYSGLTSLARLYFRAMGKEANSTTNVTPSTNFSAGSAIRSRNNAAAILNRSEWRINTSTGETSNPTLAVSGDTASLFAALEEYDLASPTTVTITAVTLANTPVAFTTNARKNLPITAGSIVYTGQSVSTAAPIIVTVGTVTETYSGQAFSTNSKKNLSTAAGALSYIGRVFTTNAKKNLPVTARTMTYSPMAFAVLQDLLVPIGTATMSYTGRTVFATNSLLDGSLAYDQINLKITLGM